MESFFSPYLTYSLCLIRSPGVLLSVGLPLKSCIYSPALSSFHSNSPFYPSPMSLFSPTSFSSLVYRPKSPTGILAAGVKQGQEASECAFYYAIYIRQRSSTIPAPLLSTSATLSPLPPHSFFLFHYFPSCFRPNSPVALLAKVIKQE